MADSIELYLLKIANNSKKLKEIKEFQQIKRAEIQNFSIIEPIGRQSLSKIDSLVSIYNSIRETRKNLERVEQILYN